MNVDPAAIHGCITLIFIQDNKVLLQFRSQNRKYYPNCYALPGGKVEYSESITQASIREAAEELGVMVEAADLQLQHVCYFKRAEDDFGLVFFMLVKTWKGQILNLEPEKHPEIGWFEINSLPENLAIHHRKALENIKHNILFEEVDWSK